ncbi:hypothetical protein KKG58_05025 [Patescibacteria group bacterium]|nr:hypothetical protein [Patescibacteria group bacterium]
MLTSEQLEQEIKSIKKRNQRVENDKTWETSYLRRILLFIYTYLAIGIYFNVIDIAKPWLNAVVPSIAFLLSTLTLPFFKKLWLKYIYKK